MRWPLLLGGCLFIGFVVESLCRTAIMAAIRTAHAAHSHPILHSWYRSGHRLAIHFSRHAPLTRPTSTFPWPQGGGQALWCRWEIAVEPGPDTAGRWVKRAGAAQSATAHSAAPADSGGSAKGLSSSGAESAAGATSAPATTAASGDSAPGPAAKDSSAQPAHHNPPILGDHGQTQARARDTTGHTPALPA